MYLASKAVNLFTFKRASPSPNQVKKTKSFDYAYTSPGTESTPTTADKVLSRDDSFDKRLDKVSTSEYVVKDNESLNSIAVRLNITPSALAKINKFPSAKTNIFPGQRIKVPVEPLVCPTSSSLSPNSPTDRRAPGMAARQNPSSLHTSTSSRRPHSMIEVRDSKDQIKVDQSEFQVEENHFEKEDSEAVERQFVKLSVDRVLLPEKNFLKGTLLVTPAILLFDPFDADDELANHKDVIFGVSLPLANITSMNTHYSLDELLEDKSLHHSESDRKMKENYNSGQTESPPTIDNVNLVSESQDEDKAEENVENKCNDDKSVDEILESQPPPNPTSSDSKLDAEPKENKECTDETVNPISEENHSEEVSQLPAAQTESTAEEKSLNKSEIVSKSAKSSDKSLSSSTALYLSLRGFESEESSFIPGLSACPTSELYLFLVPASEISNLYAFLLESTASNSNMRKTPNKINSQREKLDGGEQVEGQMHDATWEVIDEAEQLNHPVNSMVASVLKDLEEEHFLPLLRGGESLILTNDEMLDELSYNFPIHLTGCNLKLLFTTTRDGFSLHSIYRKLRDESGCILVLIRDSDNICFGALMSEKMHSSQYFYGNGETFVFNWKPKFKKYPWSGSNNFFMKGDAACFSIGAKSGHNAIWFDDILKNGRSEATETFNNPILCGGTSSAFTIDCLEVWGFIS